MNWVIDRIKTLKKKQKPKQVIALLWDHGGYGDEPSSYIYKSHNEVTETITVRASDSADTYKIEEREIDDVKHVILLDKNFRSKMNSLKDDKRPKNFKRHVGIELELISTLSQPEMVMALVKAGVEKFVTVKEDGSIEAEEEYTFTHELAVLATEGEFANVIRKISKALKGNSSVNASCGMHVHLDMRTRNPDCSYAALFEAQPILFAMCPKSRRTGEYSVPVETYKMFTKDVVRLSDDNERYFGINKSAYMTHRTIEIRMHSGTLLADKIINWVNLLIKIVDNVQVNSFSFVKSCNELKTFKKRAKIRGRLAKYVETRIESFKGDHKDYTFAQVS